jgi:hypothetical protein
LKVTLVIEIGSEIMVIALAAISMAALSTAPSSDETRSGCAVVSTP